jgi:hypothetical protein
MVSPISESQPARELRRAARQSTNDLAIVTLGSSTHVPAGDSYPVQLQDLSMRGARFYGRVPLQRGDHFVLYLPHGDRRVTMLATAVHVSTMENGHCTVGAEFSCVLRPYAREEMPSGLQEAELSRIRAIMLDD